MLRLRGGGGFAVSLSSSGGGGGGGYSDVLPGAEAGPCSGDCCHLCCERCVGLGLHLGAKAVGSGDFVDQCLVDGDGDGGG